MRVVHLFLWFWSDVSLDAMDISGEQHSEIWHDLTKQRLSSSQKPIGKPFTHHLGHKETVSSYVPPNGCGSCYGAEAGAIKCCNSCDELKEAYKAKGWSVAGLEQMADQCKTEAADAVEQAQMGEGCRLKGSLSVNKVRRPSHASIEDLFDLSSWNRWLATSTWQSETFMCGARTTSTSSIHPSSSSITRVTLSTN